MKILVTGACGFIGSHLVEQLIKKNFNVKAFTFIMPVDQTAGLII